MRNRLDRSSAHGPSRVVDDTHHYRPARLQNDGNRGHPPGLERLVFEAYQADTVARFLLSHKPEGEQSLASHRQRESAIRSRELTALSQALGPRLHQRPRDGPALFIDDHPPDAPDLRTGDCHRGGPGRIGTVGGLLGPRTVEADGRRAKPGAGDRDGDDHSHA